MSKAKEMYQDLRQGKIHKSLFQSFVSCKAQLRFLILRFEEPELVVLRPDPMSEFLKTKGSFFHDFGNYFSMITNEEGFQEQLFKRYKKRMLKPMFIEEIRDFFREYTIPEEEQKDADSPFVLYYALVEAFLEFEARRLCNMTAEFDDRMLLWKPYATELKFDRKAIVTLPDKLIDHFSFSDMLFHVKGTVDRINRHDLDASELEIMEYKTGGWSTTSSTKLTRVRRELAFYGLFNSPHWIEGSPWEVKQMSCYNPEVPPAIGFMTQPIKSVTTTAMLKQLVKFNLAIEDDDFDHPCCNPYICSYCDYLEETCPKYYKHQWDDKIDNLQDAKDKRQIQRSKNVAPY